MNLGNPLKAMGDALMRALGSAFAQALGEALLSFREKLRRRAARRRATARNWLREEPVDTLEFSDALDRVLLTSRRFQAIRETE
jgi:uncharacterized membrane protein